MSAVTRHEFSGNLFEIGLVKEQREKPTRKVRTSHVVRYILKEYVCTVSSVKRWHPSSILNLDKERMHSAKRARKLIRFRGIADALK